MGGATGPDFGDADSLGSELRRAFVFSGTICRALHSFLERGRRKTGARAPSGPVCKLCKSTTRHTGERRASRPPCAMVFTAYIAISPVNLLARPPENVGFSRA